MKKITDKIIYEDEQIIVCHKNAGTSVQTKNIRQMDMERELLNYRAQKNEKAEIYVVHRLDQPVEGVIVFAKNKEAAASLSKQLQNNAMTKEYLAVVDNGFSETSVHLEDYLLKNQKENCSKVVSKAVKGSKLAVLDVKVLENKLDKQLVKVNLHTGRHHQIRVQLSNAGCSIVGDVKYNSKYLGHRGNIQTALCAYKLSFCHPFTKKEMQFNVLPECEAFKEFNIDLEKIV